MIVTVLYMYEGCVHVCAYVAVASQDWKGSHMSFGLAECLQYNSDEPL